MQPLVNARDTIKIVIPVALHKLVECGDMDGLNDLAEEAVVVRGEAWFEGPSYTVVGHDHNHVLIEVCAQVIWPEAGEEDEGES